ncbi:GlsB/YeaQ/YmgE family stress response membrane protein [Eubacterium aggregans]|uniref:GlsB/YeaQ/YmgE family stress response membrane protein n=1 Tax=Eubacterium aggregans TaxID=81409 RepID=UPI003F4180A6
MGHLLWVMIIGGIIGAVAGAIASRDLPAGCVGNIAAGIIGSIIGEKLFGYWGPTAAGMAIVPSIIGALILVAVLDLFLHLRKK